MHAATALTQADALFRMVARLEPQARSLTDLRNSEIAGGMLVPSSVDPGSFVLLVVANAAPAARGMGDRRWWDDNRRQVMEATRRRVSDITVIFPGRWPEKTYRPPTSGHIRVRLVSAVHHLWVDRLKLNNDVGDLDDERRKKLLTRLGAVMTAEDEKFYTPPSLYIIDEEREADARAALKGLLANPADPMAGLTVLFGPGGIGKSFFLRHVSFQLARQAKDDPTVGIPVYAELPLLLHTDALETWLSGQGIQLPLFAIRTLVEEGVIVPILDALDELVRGQAREGSRQFLARLRDGIGEQARSVLSSRDYYLNLDPLVPTELGKQAVYLSVGFFDRSGRRRYIQVRTGLDAEHAARWANQLENQAAEALVGATEEEIASLIGHPLFLDAFCQTIVDIPPEQRAREANNFQLRSPDIFGEILEGVLRREHEEKFLPAWQGNGYAAKLMNKWKDPFTPELQLCVLRRIVLKVAASGGVGVLRYGITDPRYQRLQHGLFAFGQNTDPTAIMREILQEELGEPRVEPHVTEAEAEDVCARAVDHLVEAFRSHTLADTQPDQPKNLVFATRHRAYFDYILAEAVLENLISTISSGVMALDESFILWCIEHNIIERGEQNESPPFASCLNFVLWHRTAVNDAARAVEQYLGIPNGGSAFSEELASYLCSLALSLLLQHGQRRGGAELIGVDAASDRDCTIRIIPDIVPAVSDLTVTSCLFPRLVLRSLNLDRVTVTDTKLGALEIGDDATWRRVILSVDASVLSVHGRIDLEDCVLDVRGPAASAAQIDWTSATKVVLRKCQLSRELYDHLSEQAKLSGSPVQLQDCTPIERYGIEQYSPGRQFINRLINLSKKHGHREYGVYREKLKGLSLATPATFSSALNVLVRCGVIESANDNMIKLTPLAEEERYSGKAVPGQRAYAEVADFWSPIVEQLDRVFD